MKWFMYISGIMMAIFTHHFLACPTCIGIPKQGERPYFERRGIHYRRQQQNLERSTTTDPQNLPKDVKNQNPVLLPASPSTSPQ